MSMRPTLVLLLFLTLVIPSTGDSVDFVVIDDGSGIDGSIGMESPDFSHNAILQEEYIRQRPWPDYLRYNSSFSLGRDAKSMIIWFSMRINTWLVNVDIEKYDQPRPPGTVFGENSSRFQTFYLFNRTRFSGILRFHNARVVEFVERNRPEQIFPLWIGDSTGADGIEPIAVNELDIVSLRDDSVEFDLYAEGTYDNFGIRFEVMEHPAYMVLDTTPLKSREYYDNIVDPTHDDPLYYEKRATALVPDRYSIGNEGEEIEFGKKIPLTYEKLVGGGSIPQDPFAPLGRFGGLGFPTFSQVSSIGAILGTPTATYAYSGASLIIVYMQVLPDGRKRGSGKRIGRRGGKVLDIIKDAIKKNRYA